MIIRFKVLNILGEFYSETMEVSEEQYTNLVEMSKTFWITNTSFSIWTENGSVIFPPKIASESILVIEIVNS